MIRHHDDFKTVAEREAGNLGSCGGAGGDRQGGGQRNGNEQKLAHECGLQSGLRRPKNNCIGARSRRGAKILQVTDKGLR